MIRRLSRYLSPAAVLAAAMPLMAAPGDALTIGSQAPPLAIEHYVSDGAFGPVEEFKKDRVYIVEFWATWCGPCIQSMPHLAQLQEAYRDEDVQLVSVSTEPLDTVTAFLKRESPVDDKTFGQLTSVYTLTTDPDESVYEAYMTAAGQTGIPTAFIVGKTGIVEWFGHPVNMDEPLEKIVKGSWDREAYKKEIELEQQFQIVLQKINRLGGTGQYEDAMKVIDRFETEFIKTAEESSTTRMIGKQLENFRYNLRLDSGDFGPEVLTFFRAMLEDAQGDPRQVTQFAYGILASTQETEGDNPLIGDAVKAVNREVEEAPAGFQVAMHHVVAQLQAVAGNWDEAVSSQKLAVEAADDRQKERMTEVLGELEQAALNAKEASK